MPPLNLLQEVCRALQAGISSGIRGRTLSDLQGCSPGRDCKHSPPLSSPPLQPSHGHHAQTANINTPWSIFPKSRLITEALEL